MEVSVMIRSTLKYPPSASHAAQEADGKSYDMYIYNIL